MFKEKRNTDYEKFNNLEHKEYVHVFSKKPLVIIFLRKEQELDYKNTTSKERIISVDGTSGACKMPQETTSHRTALNIYNIMLEKKKEQL